MKKKTLLIIAIIIFSLILVYSIYEIITWSIDNNKTKEITEELENIHINKIEINDTELKTNPEAFYIDVDFTELQNKNHYTVGYIEVVGTNVSYPVVQALDNEYYLYHSFDNSYNEAGWIFLDYRNQKDLSDKNNIIYGHNRLDGSLFASLTNVLNSSWYSNENNHLVKTSTPYENALWEVFSVYKIKSEEYYITTDFVSDEDFEEFIDILTSRSVYNFNNVVTTDDIILTLSTCYDDFNRIVLHAKKISSVPK